MKKKFDAVEFQRKAREKMSRKYTANRDAFIHELEEKYGDIKKVSRKHKITL